MSRDRLLRRLVRERFVATLLSGETFDGLLDRFDASHVELIDAHALGKDGHRVAIDGRLYLPRVQISYLQRPEAT